MASTKEKIIIEADDKTAAAFRSIMKNANQMASEGARINKIWGNMGSIVSGISVGFLAREIGQVITSVDGMAKSAKVAGVLPETLQELRFAMGQLADISNEEVDGALEKFNTRLGMAIELGGPAKDTFRELGISIQDNNGAFRDSESLLDETLVQLKGITNDSVRAAKASELFGKTAGPKLAQAIGESGQSIEELRDHVRNTGLVLSNDLVLGAEDAADKIDEMKVSLGTQFSTVVLENTENIILLANAAMQAASGFAQGAGAAVEFFNSLDHDDAAKLLTSNLERQVELEKQIGNLKKHQEELAQKGNRRNKGREAGEKEMLSALEQELAYQKSLEAGLQQRVKDQADEHRIKQQLKADAAAAAAQDKKRRDADFAAEQARKEQVGKKDTLALDPWGDAIEEARTQRMLDEWETLEAEAKEHAEAIKKTQEEMEKEGTALAESMRTPLESYNAELKHLKVLLEGTSMGQDTYNRAVDAARQNLNAAQSQAKDTSAAVRDIGLTFTSAAEEAAFSGAKISDVVKGILEDLAKLAFRKMVTEPLLGAFSNMMAPGVTGGSSVLGMSGEVLGTIPGYRASGGPVNAGDPYIVGERGPELFVPGHNGGIVSNDKMGGTTVQVSIGNIDARGADANAVASLKSYMENEFAARIVAISKREAKRDTLTTLSRPRFA